MVGAIEVIGKERHIVSTAVVERGCLVITPGVGVNSRIELARQPGDSAHLGIHAFGVANHCWYEIGPGFAVQYELRFLHQGSAAAVLGRVVGKAHHNLVHGWQAGPQGSFEAVVILGALVHVRIHAVQAQPQGPDIRLQPGPQQHGRSVGKVRIFDGPGRNGFNVKMGALDTRSQEGEAGIRRGQVEAGAIKVNLRQGQRREAGDQPIADNGAVSPVVIAVAAHHQKIENRAPLVAILEDATAVFLTQSAALGPVVQVVTSDEGIAEGIVEGPGSVGVGEGVVRVVGIALKGVVIVLG